MFFIFGWGPRVKDLGPADFRTCSHYNHQQWRRLETSNWITLFFIPVIPTGRKVTEQCPICGFGYDASA